MESNPNNSLSSNIYFPNFQKLKNFRTYQTADNKNLHCWKTVGEHGVQDEEVVEQLSSVLELEQELLGAGSPEQGRWVKIHYRISKYRVVE